MTQLPLFTASGAPSRPRNLDPSTEARERHSKSGAMATNRARVLAALKRIGHPATAAEIERGIEIDAAEPLTEVRRRLHDLSKDGAIICVEFRRCRVAGTSAKAWRATK